MNAVDTEALIRSIVIAVVIGLLLFGLFSSRSGKDGDQQGRQSFLPVIIGLTLLIAIILYYAWPSLVEVPKLEGLSKNEAIELLQEHNLVPELDSQITIRIKPGEVIQGSQNPPPGQKVSTKSRVKFTVSKFTENSIQFSAPLSNTEAKCEILPSNIGRVYVSATIKISSNQIPLLWIHAVDSPTPVWYLQKYPFGLSKGAEEDFWFGHAQIGNPEYPPIDGSIFDFAITIIDKAETNKLISSPGEFSSPNPMGHSIVTAKNVSLETVRK
jgi:hypothetical protein